MGQTRSVKLRYTLPALADLGAILDYLGADAADCELRHAFAIASLNHGWRSPVDTAGAASSA